MRGVLIVGAGPVGLTMAAALTHQGIACRIVDRAPAPSDRSKALAIWSRTLELLDGLGLADTFVAHGLRVRGASMYAEGERLVHVELAGVDSPFGFPLMIPQSETERLLHEHLDRQGVTVERGVELSSFAQTADVVRCRLRHADGREEQVETPWLVGCDGAHSAVRHGLGLEFTGHAEPSDWLLADVHVDGPLAADEIGIYWHAHGVLAVFPIGGRRFRVMGDVGTASGAPKPDPTLAEAQAVVDERGPGGLTLSNPVWLTHFRINERKVDRYRVGRVMLAGDAAHIHSPAGGQGMNTGMQDAFNLAWKLALVQHGAGLVEPLLESYSRERSAVGEQVLRNAEAMTTLATLRSPVQQWVRNHVAPVVAGFGFVRDRLRNQMSELSIGYRESPLSAEQWPLLAGGIAAGDRLCDAPLVDARDGRDTTLFAAIRGTRHALLLVPGSSEPGARARLVQIAAAAVRQLPDVLAVHVLMHNDEPAPTGDAHVRDWYDRDGRVHEKLAASQPTLVVVRPDGYVGFRCQPADGEALMRYLRTYLAVDRDAPPTG